MTQIPAGSLVVSCQAAPGNPFFSPAAMALMAQAAQAGGAAAIRANGPEDLAAIRAVTDLPLIGLHKLGDPSGVFITPTFEAAAGAAAAGADLIAIDATQRPRPDGTLLADQIARIHTELGLPVLADVDTHAAGLAARAAGADLVATTLSGYTNSTSATDPDIALIDSLASTLDCPVIAEGRFRTAADVRAARAAGAHAVVVGTAITNPMLTTAWLAAAL
ncbi:putative N-acetylmannosamine-6-phosphate 2-epimerase [Kribbella sp. DT2]|uniref:putative N-acetylmannosamine-6-phosphate 2-epimerase n=1 Tax=Kribbella sp. DT2 TaxID=3393427 RepID=UPI003CEF1C65